MISKELLQEKINKFSDNKFIILEITKKGNGKNTKCIVTVKCKLDNNIFKIPLFDLLNQKRGCKECYSESMRKTLKDYQELSNEKYPGLYEALRLTKNKSDQTVCEFRCKNEHIFYQRFQTHKESGCAKCDDHSQKLTIEEIRIRSRNSHTVYYDIQSISINYKNNDNHIVFKCPNCNEAQKRIISKFLASYGCTFCSAKMSFGEKLVMNYLKDNKIKFERQYEIVPTIDNPCPERTYLDVDFVISCKTIKLALIEFDGRQHKTLVTFGKYTEDEALENLRIQKIRDAWLNNYCLINKIPLIRIDGTIYNTKEKIYAYLDQELAKLFS